MHWDKWGDLFVDGRAFQTRLMALAFTQTLLEDKAFMKWFKKLIQLAK